MLNLDSHDTRTLWKVWEAFLRSNLAASKAEPPAELQDEGQRVHRLGASVRAIGTARMGVAFCTLVSQVLKDNGQVSELTAIEQVHYAFLREEVRHVEQYTRDTKSLQAELAQLRAEVTHYKDLCLKDALTGLYNRRFWNEQMTREVARSQRADYSFVVALLDVDDFKSVNDTFGYTLGDEVLVHLATLPREQLRDADILARFGGDEFALLMAETSLDAALQTCERLRSLVEAFAWHTRSSLVSS